MSLETFVLDIIEGRRRAPVARGILFAMSRLYEAGVRLRHFAYDKKWIKSQKVPAFVISIGNIVAGGTGKTPLTYLLAKTLSQRSKVAILTRGYRSENERRGIIKKVDGQTQPKDCGDEALLLHKKLPDVAVWVGRDRVKSAKRAIAEGAEILILDDGMQFRELQRDLEIVVMDGTDPFGRGYFLPRGLLRDTPDRLENADFLIVNHEGKVNVNLPTIHVNYRLQNDFEGKKVGLFCGIGRPRHFAAAVKKTAQIVDFFLTRDHTIPSEKQLIAFAQRCKKMGAQMLVCTEKDAVKLPPDLSLCLPITVAVAEMEITEGDDHWKNLLKRVYESRD